MNFNFKTLALAAGLALASQAASAASYTFNGQVSDSALNPGLLGEKLVVLFSFSDAAAALLPGGAGEVSLDSLELTFLGKTVQLSEAIDAYAQFDAGQLIGPSATFEKFAGGTGTLALSSAFASSFFAYSVGGQDSLGDLAVSAVPEPSTWALGLAGILALGAVARRRSLKA